MSVLGPGKLEKMSQFIFKWIVLVPMELIHNPQLFQISFFFLFARILELSRPETDKMCQFLGPETDP